ncbi:MAG: hypothetical protein HFH82_10220 [Lachnospiraceae bacterium]|nr:hypothetical protein [Lachnospiraceae bacterium]
MPKHLKKITFVFSPDMEPLLEEIKKEMFCSCSQSEMIRTLVEAGWNAVREGQQNILPKQIFFEGSGKVTEWKG